MTLTQEYCQDCATDPNLRVASFGMRFAPPGEDIWGLPVTSPIWDKGRFLLCMYPFPRPLIVPRKAVNKGIPHRRNGSVGGLESPCGGNFPIHPLFRLPAVCCCTAEVVKGSTLGRPKLCVHHYRRWIASSGDYGPTLS